MNITYLAWRNIVKKPLRTVCLVIVISLFSITVFSGSILVQNLSYGVSNMANKLGADILVVPYGYEKTLETAILRGEPSGFYLKKDLLESIKKVEGIELITPQLFLASLDASCCSAKVQLIGFEEESDFIVSPWLKDSLSNKLADNEVIVGSKITSDAGEEITFFNQKFQIVTKAQSTGMGFDTSVFMTMNSARNLLKNNNITQEENGDFDEYISSILIRVNPKYNSEELIDEMVPKYTLGYNLDFLITKDMMSSIYKWLSSFSNVIYGVSALFWIIGAVVIFTIYFSTINERRREVSILRIIGASKKTLTKMLLLESLMIGVIGGILGIVISLIIIISFKTLIFQSLGLPHLNLSFAYLALCSLLTLILSLSLGLFASIYSVIVVAKSDLHNAIKEAG